MNIAYRWRVLIASLLLLILVLGGAYLMIQTILRSSFEASSFNGLDPYHLQQIERRFQIFFLTSGVVIFVLLIILISPIFREHQKLLDKLISQRLEKTYQANLIQTMKYSSPAEITSFILQQFSELSQKVTYLETEKEKNKAILNVMSDGVIIVSPDGRVIMSNMTAHNLFNITNQDIQGAPLISITRHHQVIELWERCLSTQEQVFSSLEIPTLKLYLNIIATPLGQTLPGHVLLLFQDLTQLRKLEIIRKELISNISHELKTPIASLTALTETLIDISPEDIPAIKKFVSRIQEEVYSMNTLIRDILDLSRIESGSVSLNLESLEPQDIVDTVINRLQEQIENKDIQLSIIIEENLPPILGDKARMEWVLLNLIQNAIKYVQRAGNIEIKASFFKEEKSVIFSITDDGPGISAEEIPRIFERFYKVDNSRHSEGSGLGLAISKHLVEMHGGRIWVESVENSGSTFYFTIPTISSSTEL